MTFDNHKVISLTFPANLAELKTFGEEPLHLILVIDVSGSMNWEQNNITPWKLVQQTVRNTLLFCIDKEVYVDFVFFNHEVIRGKSLATRSVKISSKISSDEKDVVTFAEMLHFVENKSNFKPERIAGTNIYKGLNTALEIKRVTVGEKLVDRKLIIITDGGDSNDKEIKDKLTKACNKNTNVFCIGLGLQVSRSVVEMIGQYGLGASRCSGDFANLDFFVAEMLKLLTLEPRKVAITEPSSSVKSSICINNGILSCDQEQCMFVPEKEHIPYLFSNTTTELYIVFKGNLPEKIKLSIDDKNYEILKSNIEEVSDGDTSSMQRRFVRAVYNELRNTLSDYLSSNYAEQFEKAICQENCSSLIEKLKIDESLTKNYKELLIWCVKKNILCEDTSLLFGDNLKPVYEWLSKQDLNEKLIDQLTNSFKESENINKYKNICFDCLDGPGDPLLYVPKNKNVSGKSSSDVIGRKNLKQQKKDLFLMFIVWIMDNDSLKQLICEVRNCGMLDDVCLKMESIKTYQEKLKFIVELYKSKKLPPLTYIQQLILSDLEEKQKNMK